MYKRIPKGVKNAARSAMIGLVEKGAEVAAKSIEPELKDAAAKSTLDELRSNYVAARSRVLVEGPDAEERGDGLYLRLKDDARAALEHAFDAERLIAEKARAERAKAIVLTAIDGAFKVAEAAAGHYLYRALGVSI